MRHFFFTWMILLSFNLYAQKNAWQGQCNRIDSLLSEGLPKSALTEADKLYTLAKSSKKNDYLLKAIFYKISIAESYEDDFLLTEYYALDKEVKQATTPVKQVLSSFQAELLWRYYQQNRWMLMDRNQVMGEKSDSVHLWDVKTITAKTIQLYNASLLEKEALQKVQLKEIEILINRAVENRKLRATLYDLLAHRAIDFFMHSESGLTEPEYVFTLNDPMFFSTVNDFGKLTLLTRDSLSFKYYALSIFKDLFVFHLADADPDALIDADLKRLTFLKAHAALPEKDSLYEQALIQLQKKYTDKINEAPVLFALASYYQERSQKFNKKDSSTYRYKNDKLKAASLCKKMIEAYAKSPYVVNAQVLLSELQKPVITHQTEQVNVPGKPFRALVTYSNIDILYARIYKQKDIEESERDMPINQRINAYLKKTPVTAWQQVVPAYTDLLSHTAEIAVKGLAPGTYVMLTSTNSTFDYENKTSIDSNQKQIAYSKLIISDLAYMSTPAKDGGFDLYVLNRTSGKPVNACKVIGSEYSYDYRKNERTLSVKNNYTTDNNGYIHLPKRNPENRVRTEIELSNGDDSFTFDMNLYNRWQWQEDQTVIQERTFLFTDRAIYRPGQTIWFKGIQIETDGKKMNRLVKQKKISVEFKDVNYQNIATQELTSNDFGSFHGSFVIPANILTGQMQIVTTYGSAYVNVEEYKRPKFDVNFEPIQGNYKLNEEVTVTGLAKAFAGSAISDASVSYRVVRQVRYPFYRWYYESQNSEEMEIKHGKVTTDEQGTFAITFKARPSQTANRKNNPMFDYTVYADVTDINGETHSSVATVSVGYVSLILNTDMPDKINSDSAAVFKINTTNTSGTFTAASGTITIKKLNESNRLLRERYWPAADTILMFKEDYVKEFPNDVFDELDKQEEGKVIASMPFNTADSKKFSIDKINEFAQGSYQVSITSKDTEGNVVENIHYVTIYSSKQQEMPVKKYDWFVPVKTTAEPGEKAILLVGSAAKNASFFYMVEQEGNILVNQWLNISEEQKIIELPIQESYRGNVNIHLWSIINNRCYSHTQSIYVPYTNKELQLSFESFRDKLQPGQQEEWRIKVRGSKADKVAAEMLAVLYDASLDELMQHTWSFDLFRPLSSDINWSGQQYFSKTIAYPIVKYKQRISSYTAVYPAFLDLLNGYGSIRLGRGGSGRAKSVNSPMYDMAMPAAAPAMESRGNAGALEEMVVTGYSASKKENVINSVLANGTTSTQKQVNTAVAPKARSNFNETAFFMPQLTTNEQGEVIIKFTIPESLTRWKMMGLAHTADLSSGMISNTLVTQKDVMVTPNMPRFLRESDSIVLSAKIANITDKEIDGTVSIEFVDALTDKSLHLFIASSVKSQSFKVEANGNTVARWQISVPSSLGAVKYKIMATYGQAADGEENVLPVLANSQLVTESMPLPVRGNQTRSFEMTKLTQSVASTTLKQHKLTIEYTSNPVWYVVQALPYLMEYPYECSEQLFNRFYANALARSIADNTSIKQVFDNWKNLNSTALLSNLEKNQELKSILIEETPWLREAKDESERKKRIALLFDLSKMAQENEAVIKKLIERQLSNGAFPWFKGMHPDRYITQYILTGIGHLKKLGIDITMDDNKNEQQAVRQMIRKALDYLDNEMYKTYVEIKREYPDKMKENHLSSIEINYLYMRSFFKNEELASKHKEAYTFFVEQAKTYWLSQSLYLQGMIGLALHRNDDTNIPQKIITSLKEKSLKSDELGIWWRDLAAGYYWHQAPIEAQSLLIEFFNDVAQDKPFVEEMKLWLLKQKQTQDWKTTRATAEACYAFLLNNSQLKDNTLVKIKVGSIDVNQKIQDDQSSSKQVPEPGTGYIKTQWESTAIKPDMGKVTVTKTTEGVAWGALYWQYFEQLDKITFAATPVKINKSLFVETPSASGPVLAAIKDNAEIHVGDKVWVRIEITVDRNMEYVHLKDMRAAGFEPLNVLSGYKYNNGLGYYESTRDAATNFFISYLPKGKYVFEYALRASNAGSFSNGIATLQCMYAPEFSSHSNGIRVKIK